MNDQEKARIIAEKVMGWTWDDRWNPPRLFRYENGVQVCVSADYDPANNIAQAIEAARKFITDNEISFSISHPGEYRDCGEDYLEWKPWGWMVIEIGGYIKTVDDNNHDPHAMAAAIVNALLAALEGGGC